MHFPYGEIVKEFPSHFTPPEMWPEYGYAADPAPLCKREIVQDDPVGLRWSLWPFTFEQYWGDNTPDVDAAAKRGELTYNRMVLWRRLHDGATPEGWHRSVPGIFRVDGYQTLDGSDFTKRWNKNARRDLQIWNEKHANKTHVIEEITFEEFSNSYKKSLISKRKDNARLEDLERRLAYPEVRANTRLFGVRSMHNGTTVAGVAVAFSPTYKSSTHVAPFILEEAREIYAATALIYHWFEESRRKGCPTVMTLNFWHPGKPKDWKGFSEFKSHFGFTYVTYPPALWRFVRGKFW